MTVFNGSMGDRVYVCAASHVGKKRSKETKWSYERVECAARVVGRARDYVCRMEQKSCLPFEEINVEVTVSLCFWLFRGEACGLQKMLPRGKVVARCRSGIRYHNRHGQFWGWNKVVPGCGVLNLSNSCSTGIPWSKRNRRKGSINLSGSFIMSMLLLLLLLLLLLKNSQWDVCIERGCSAKETASPISAARKGDSEDKSPGMFSLFFPISIM